MMRTFLCVGVLLGLFTSIDVAAEVITIGAAKGNTLSESAKAAVDNQGERAVSPDRLFTSSPVAATSDGLTELALADTVEVTTVSLTFVPANVTIEVGDSILFTGLLGGFHTVAEVDDANANTWNGGFHSPPAASEFTFMFNTPGTFFYICEPHVLAGMRGTVTVNAPPAIGACCLESRGECTDDIDAADCSALGGRFGGDGSTCAIIDPACEPPLSISLVLVAGGVAAAEENAGPGLTAPVFLTHAGDGSGRLFVVDQVGQIRIIKNGTLLPTPFLDLTSKIISINAFFDERGVLGLAFHPDYANNGRFFVRYSAPRSGAPTDPCFYPGFVNGCHEEILAEYAVSGDPDVADPTSEIILFRVDEPEFNHDSGQVMFGPDGLLYWTLGDGGGGNDGLHRNGLCDAGHCAGDDSVCSVSAQDCVDVSVCVSDEGFCTIPPDSTPPVLCNDGFECVAISAQDMPHGPIGNGQNKDTPLGSLLRIDVDSTPDAGLNYKVPPGNPFAGGGGTPEIYAYGLRNPYRFSFATVGASDVAIVGDVGQALFEEIDFIPISDTPGLLNYGWATREGFSCFDPFDVVTPPSTCATTGPSGEPLLDPVADYPHPTPCAVDADCVNVGSVCNSEGFCNNIAGIAVIGGFVYSGTAYPALSGRYFFGDFGQSFVVPGGRLFYMDIALDRAGSDSIHEVFIAPNGDPFGLALFGIGEDEDGELYVLAADNIGPSGNGFVFRVVAPEPQAKGLSPRYLEIKPPPNPEPFFITVTPDCPSGTTKFVGMPFGEDNFAQLEDFPTALDSTQWGSPLRVFGTTIVPNTTYAIRTDFGTVESPAVSPSSSALTSIHGDVAGLENGVFLPPDGTFTFVVDVVAIVQAFTGSSAAPPVYQTDLAGTGVSGIKCLPDQNISIIIDVVVAIDAFQGGNGSILNCPVPCP